MLTTLQRTPAPLVVREFTVNLAQVAATYDLCSASGGDLQIVQCGIYVATAGGTFTSVAVQTNQTTAFVILSATDGVVANIVAQKTVPTTWTQAQPFILRSTQKVQFTLVGATGTGSLKINFAFRPIGFGGDLV